MFKELLRTMAARARRGMAAAAAEPRKPRKLAEKPRVSTCAFADKVARCAIDACRRVGMLPKETGKEIEGGEKGGNTVVAAFVVLEEVAADRDGDGDGEERGSVGDGGGMHRKRLRVIALGKGTKVCSHRIIAGNHDGRSVHDMHAEVLARRSLLRVLYRELMEGGGRLLERCGGASDAYPRFRWRRDISLHMYISSAPCGNATLKRWATSKKETFLEDFDEWTWPRAPNASGRDVGGESVSLSQQNVSCPVAPIVPKGWNHDDDKFTSFAAREGQVAALVKRDPDIAMLRKLLGTVHAASESGRGGDDVPRSLQSCETENETRAKIEQLQKEFEASPLSSYPRTDSRSDSGIAHADVLEAILSDRTVVPAGTSIPGAHEGCVLTCSDKLAIWNCIGLQGALLSRFINPVYLDTITVGRKFSQAHMRRAMCCRMQSFDILLRHRYQRATNEGDDRPVGESFLPPQEDWLPRVRHPTLMCTNVKLDDGDVDRDEPATFDSVVGESWADGDGEQTEKVSASTGALVADDGGALPEGAVSKISKRTFFASYKEVSKRLGVDCSCDESVDETMYTSGARVFMKDYLREKSSAGRWHHEGRVAIHDRKGTVVPKPTGRRHKRIPRLFMPGEDWPTIGYIRKRDYFWS